VWKINQDKWVYLNNMALHKDFPRDKFQVLDPAIRWFPADEDLRKEGYEKLLPPFVPELRERVAKWRKDDYAGASETSKALLNWWFKESHTVYAKDGASVSFQYYFAQREAVETIVWLYDVQKVSNKYDLIKFDKLGRVSPNMFDEDWLRFVIKMATGSGKTKVMSLLLAWSYFHKCYEKNSGLSKNFLLITPNIIVLDRIKADFEGLKIFYEDPILPDNGYGGQNWQDDFQIKLHLQDEVGAISKSGNIFLTNIHRVYEKDITEAGFGDEDSSDYFLGSKVTGKTNDSKIDLGEIIRDVDELMVINDEAHHIHDPKMAWFKSIEDINNKLLQKGKKIALQIDVTATPKNNRGEIFVQTVCDYPLVEAIRQGVVKNPVLPDQASRAKLREGQSSIFSEKYEDYIRLGVEEWEKTYKELEPTGKKSILFIMTDDTRNCDDVAEFLEKNYPRLRGAVLTIHTNKSGEISETVSGKKEKELRDLRKKANEIDSMESPHKVIVSVLMLKEGWDVKNVTTIVGLRPYGSDSKILPEQTLGRGLRRMFFGQDVEEYVSIIGTPAFMEFVESINAEGVELERRKMDRSGSPITPTVIEVDNRNEKKDIENLDIELPVLTPRIQREYKNLNLLNISGFKHEKISVKQFTEEEKKEVVFREIIEDKEHHRTILETKINPNYQSAIGWFTQRIMRELRLFGCYDILFGKVKEFVADYLFKQRVDLTDLNILQNLSELEAIKTIVETFKKEINNLTVQDVGDTEIKNYLKVSGARPFVVTDKKYFLPKKSVFNKIVGDNDFELEFADFLENADDVVSFAKNYFEIHFKIDYKNASGAISGYYPDFFVKTDNKTIYIVETKGRDDLDDIEKIKRLAQWCADASGRQKRIEYKMIYVKQEEWEKYKPVNFKQLASAFALKG
jgi:type III restriction enzyme